jgi:hypothetical protein
VQITKVTLDNVLQPGSPYYYIAVNVGYSGSDSWSVNPFDFKLISNTGAVYSLTYSINEANQLSAVTLQNGQHDTGELAFQLSSGQVPATLEYVAPGFQVQVHVPPVSSWVSEVNLAPDTVIQGPNETLSSISVFGIVQNSTIYFRTGDIIAVKLSITYNPIGQSGSMSLISVTDSDGFSISKIQPALPATITGNGQELDVVVYLSAPATSYSGDLHFNLTFSY